MANPLESRRDFLKLSGTALGSLTTPRWFAAWLERYPVAEKPKPIAVGVLMTTEGVDREILEVVSEPTFPVPTGLKYVGGIEVAGVRGYNYLIQTNKGLVEIPLNLVTVLAGNPFPVERKTNFIGIRNDVIEFMPFVDLAGMSSVRISRNVEEIGNPDSKLERLIREALGWGYQPLIVFNTRDPRSEGEVRKMARELVTRYDVDIELLNEPNEATYWRDGDLETAADAIAIATDEIKKVRPSTRVIVAALTDPNKMVPFTKLLRERRLNFNQVEFAAHGYGEPWVIDWVVEAVVRATGKPAVVTEFGVMGENKRGIIALLDRLWQLRAKGWVSQAFIHELHDFEGWGFVNPYLEITMPSFYYLPAWVRNHSGLVRPAATPKPTRRPTSTLTPTATATPRPIPKLPGKNWGDKE